MPRTTIRLSKRSRSPGRVRTTPVIFEIRSGEVIIRHSTRGRAIIDRFSNTRPLALPFLRWAGGKQWIARIAPHLLPPTFTGSYFEPFLGAANFFLATKPRRAILSDINRELIQTYSAVAQEIEAVISGLNKCHYSKTFFLAIRKKRPRALLQIATRFIFLNKTAWNGLYRVNPRGHFNVPYGGDRNLLICPENRLRVAAPLFRQAKLLHDDFEAAVSSAIEGDLVYLDPPYITGHTNNGFLSYNSKLFSWDDQVRLSSVAKRLASRGVFVIVSNANHVTVSQLYNGFFRYIVERNSLIGGWDGTRGRVSESLLSNFPLIGIKSEVL